jgi:hypothetical protein
MKIQNIELNIEEIEAIANDLHSPIVMTAHSQYCESMQSVVELLTSPIIFMSLAISKVKETHISIENSVKLGHLFNNPDMTNPKKTAEELVDFFKQAYKKENETTVDEAYSEAKFLIENNYRVKALYHNIGLNALVNSWTMFENCIKDLWIKLLNSFPDLLNNSILNSKTENDSQLSGKNIPVTLLSKYKYNISNHLGEILVGKYDFTGTSGIKKSYKDLLGISDIHLKIFDDDHLNQLEITRHLIVHKASIIDADYLKRSKRQNENNNDKLILESEEACALINSSIKTLKEVFLFTDNKINNR